MAVPAEATNKGSLLQYPAVPRKRAIATTAAAECISTKPSAVCRQQDKTATTEADAAAVTEAVSVPAEAPSKFMSMAEAVRSQCHPIALLKEAVELQHVVHPAKKPLSLVRAGLQDLSFTPIVCLSLFKGFLACTVSHPYHHKLQSSIVTLLIWLCHFQPI